MNLPTLLPQTTSIHSNKLEELLISDRVLWKILNSTISEGFTPAYKRDYRVMDAVALCVHIVDLEKDKEMLELVSPIMRSAEEHLNIKITKMIRIKANTTFRDPDFKSHNFNIPHMDYTAQNMMTLIYYVNDSDGDTCFFENFNSYSYTLGEPTRISPKKGRTIAFKSNMYHASCCPDTSHRRVVINFCFEYEELDNEKSE